MELPQIFKFINKPTINQNTQIMKDWTDGLYIKEHSVIQKDPFDLQIVVSFNEIYTTNPIGM